jgi:hypothetical protein
VMARANGSTSGESAPAAGLSSSVEDEKLMPFPAINRL